MIYTEEQILELREKGQNIVSQLAFQPETYENEVNMSYKGECSVSDVFRLLFGDNLVRIARKKYKCFMGFTKEEKQKDTEL